MRILALPFTIVIVVVAVLLLAVSASLNLLFHWIAKFFAMIAVDIILWQKSDFLLKLISLTQRKQEETHEPDRQATQKHDD
jgi:hypothetical protein